MLGVALLNFIAGAHAAGVGAAGRLHSRKARTELLEDGPVAVLVADVVALANGASLVLSCGVGLRQLVVLLDNNAENKSYVSLPSLPLGLWSYVSGL